MSLRTSLQARARALRQEVITLWFAIRDPRTPVAARLVAAFVVAYALSPIDLIPDFIPVLGYLDDIVLIPLGIALALWLIPEPVLVVARERAATVARRPRSLVAAAVIVLVWTAAALSLAWLAWHYWQAP
jgi:uncharacterized membrane protein YkvA (DUF1232 family)